jgi:hypothetical protein
LWHDVAFARLFRSFVVARSRCSRPVTSEPTRLSLARMRVILWRWSGVGRRISYVFPRSLWHRGRLSPTRFWRGLWCGLCCAWGGATNVVEDHHLYCIMLVVDGVVVVPFFGLDPAFPGGVAECALGWVASLLASDVVMCTVGGVLPCIRSLRSAPSRSRACRRSSSGRTCTICRDTCRTGPQQQSPSVGNAKKKQVHIYAYTS